MTEAGDARKTMTRSSTAADLQFAMDTVNEMEIDGEDEEEGDDDCDSSIARAA